MRRRLACAIAALCVVGAPGAGAAVLPETEAARRADFDAFCTFVAQEDAYLDRDVVDWDAACDEGRRAAAEATTFDAFVAAFEAALRELSDAHAHLGTSTPASPRLVPTDADVLARWQGGRARIVEVRHDSAAFAAGARPGMTIASIDGRPADEAMRTWLPRHARHSDDAMRDVALNIAAAGRQDRRPVTLVVEREGRARTIAFVPRLVRPDAAVTSTRRADVGVLRIHNALGDVRTIAAFDAALDTMTTARAIVLDLRDTPSGGNTTVARGVMSRFVSSERPYQRHESIAEWRADGVRRVWVEYVEPRGRTFDGPLVVLVGHWTGSMGEGIAIGLDAARGARVVGRPMAALRGALGERTLAHSGLVVRVPIERLSHVDGTPREAFRPEAIDADDDGDGELEAAVRMAACLANVRDAIGAAEARSRLGGEGRAAQLATLTEAEGSRLRHPTSMARLADCTVARCSQDREYSKQKVIAPTRRVKASLAPATPPAGSCPRPARR